VRRLLVGIDSDALRFEDQENRFYLDLSVSLARQTEVPMAMDLPAYRYVYPYLGVGASSRRQDVEHDSWCARIFDISAYLHWEDGGKTLRVFERDRQVCCEMLGERSDGHDRRFVGLNRTSRSVLVVTGADAGAPSALLEFWKVDLRGGSLEKSRELAHRDPYSFVPVWSESTANYWHPSLIVAPPSLDGGVDLVSHDGQPDARLNFEGAPFERSLSIAQVEGEWLASTVDWLYRFDECGLLIDSLRHGIRDDSMLTVADGSVLLVSPDRIAQIRIGKRLDLKNPVVPTI
jgi:hypothetical protein